mmetsp:Transcript_46699/g.111061  ORF Transcript_46699/g.111061 Transcript_46699/m.111061 type:complete len:243 (-) Transcript_46699:6-734(-)
MVHGNLKLHHTTLPQPHGDVTTTQSQSAQEGLVAATAAAYSIPVKPAIDDLGDDLMTAPVCVPWRCLPSNCTSSCIGQPCEPSSSSTAQPDPHALASVLAEGASIPPVSASQRFKRGRPSKLILERDDEVGVRETSPSPSSSTRSPTTPNDVVEQPIDSKWMAESDEPMLPVQPSRRGLQARFLKDMGSRPRALPKSASAMASQGPPRSPGLPPAVSVWQARERGEGSKSLETFSAQPQSVC